MATREIRDSVAPVQAIRPDQEVMARQRLPYFIGISGTTVGAQGLAMHVLVIPPGARSKPHVHRGYETASTCSKAASRRVMARA